MSILEHQARSFELDRMRLVDDLFYCVQETFVEFIAKGREQFLDEVGPALDLAVRTARNKVYELGGAGMVVDALVNAIKDSNDIVAGWIQVVTDAREFQEFGMTDVVGMEAAFIHLATIDDTNFELKCFEANGNQRRKRANDIRFAGEYFQVVNSIVHNLISNAIRYSGYGDSVPLTLTAEVSGATLKITAKNHVALEARPAAIERYPMAVKLANAEIKVPRGADNNSGFDKIRMACSERSIQSIDINITRFNKRSTHYEVIVTVEHQMGYSEGA